MSGGGSGRDDYSAPPPIRQTGSGGGGEGGGQDPCDIVQTAPINSPVPAVVSTLSVGDILNVELTGTSARPILEVRTLMGQTAGSLTHTGFLSIVRCIQFGNRYQAEVVQRTGGAVVVRVQRA